MTLLLLLLSAALTPATGATTDAATKAAPVDCREERIALLRTLKPVLNPDATPDTPADDDPDTVQFFVLPDLAAGDGRVSPDGQIVYLPKTATDEPANDAVGANLFAKAVDIRLAQRIGDVCAPLVPAPADAQGLPPDVQRLQDAVASIPGVRSASVGKTDVADVPASDFSLPPYGDLPLGALRRTDGGKPDELVIGITFEITRDEQGWRALEFLAWWVRDAARGGETIQLRALALPPLGAQAGKTLTFSIDYFHVDPGQDMSRLFATIGELARSLDEAKAMYPDAFDVEARDAGR